MLNEDKIKLMTKLAVYEEKKGKDAIKSNKYYKKDYLSIKMINTALTVTFAYLLMLIIWIVYKADYLMEEITSMNMVAFGTKILILYLVILILYLLLSYIIYSVKYEKYFSDNKEYAENLKKLYMIYKKEEKAKNEVKLGGIDSDDETFGF